MWVDRWGEHMSPTHDPDRPYLWGGWQGNMKREVFDGLHTRILQVILDTTGRETSSYPIPIGSP